jgi:hypothetical protein
MPAAPHDKRVTRPDPRERTDDAPPRSDAQHVCWIAVFGANLVVPLSAALPMTAHAGRSGLLAGVAALLAGWLFVVPRFPALRGVLLPGGVALAGSQVLPLFQVAAGLVGFAVVGRRDEIGAHALAPDGNSGQPPLDDPTAFAVTVSTGGTLWVIAVLLGGALLVIRRGMRRARPVTPAGVR